MRRINEDAIEQITLAWLGELGYQLAQGADLAFDGPAAYHQYHAVNKADECTLSACGVEAPANLRFGRFA